MQRVPSYLNTTHVAALKRALAKAQHLTPEDAPRIKEAYDLAVILDELRRGRDTSGKLIITTVGRRYDELLAGLGLGYRRAEGRPRKEQAEAYVEEQGSPSALDRMMRLVANDE